MVEPRQGRRVFTSMPKKLLVLLSVSMFTVLTWSGCSFTATYPGSASESPPSPVAVLGGDPEAEIVVVEVVSEPRDAMVVLNRKPIGLTPQRIELPVTELGFVTEPVTIAVRFVARDVEEASLTQTLTLGTTDKAPLQLQFTREDVKRVFR